MSKRILSLLAFLAACRCYGGSYVLSNLDSGLLTDSLVYGINSSRQILISGCISSVCQIYVLQGSTLTPLTGFTSVQDIDDAGNIMGRQNYATVVVSNTGTQILSLDRSYRGIGLSNSGLIVGLVWDGGSFLYDGSITPINNDADYLDANDVNDSGVVVGSWRSFPSMDSHAYMWTGGVFTELIVPGAYYGFGGGAVATGINNAGQIVGLAYAEDGHQFGWILSGGVYTTLTFPGAVDTALFKINERGEFVGNYRTALDDEHGFLGVSSVPEPNAGFLSATAFAAFACVRCLRKRSRARIRG